MENELLNRFDFDLFLTHSMLRPSILFKQCIINIRPLQLYCFLANPILNYTEFTYS